MSIDDTYLSLNTLCLLLKMFIGFLNQIDSFQFNMQLAFEVDYYNHWLVNNEDPNVLKPILLFYSFNLN